MVKKGFIGAIVLAVVLFGGVILGLMKNFQSEYNRPMLPSIGGLPIVS